MKPAYWIVFVILAVTTLVTLVTFSQSIAQHTSISEVVKRPGDVLQVPGRIDKNSVAYDVTKGELRFDIVEMKPGNKTNATGGPRLTVVYSQPKPENFDTATSVEAVGIYKDGVFRASNLLVKCPSKYNDQPVKQKSVAAHGVARVILIPETTFGSAAILAGPAQFRNR